MQDIQDAFGDAAGYSDLGEWYDGWDSMPTEEQREMRKYLSAIAKGDLVSDEISASAAQSYLQSQFNHIVSMPYATLSDFPCDTISFAGQYFDRTDLSKCTGITLSQLGQASMYMSATLPDNVIVNPGDSLNGATFQGCSATQSWVTPEVWLSMNDECVVLPNMTFTGTESFVGKNLSNIYMGTLSGITAAQISQATNVTDMFITSAQYNEWGDVLNTKFAGQTVIVDSSERITLGN